MNRMQKAELLLDILNEGVDYNEVLGYCQFYFPEINFCDSGLNRSLKQIITDEIINKASL